MKRRIVSFIRDELLPALENKGKCNHKGETQEFCGKCGADLREISGYECRVCSLIGRNTVYKSDGAPEFCKKCGAPKFTFIVRKKKPSTND